MDDNEDLYKQKAVGYKINTTSTGELQDKYTYSLISLFWWINKRIIQIPSLVSLNPDKKPLRGCLQVTYKPD